MDRTPTDQEEDRDEILINALAELPEHLFDSLLDRAETTGETYFDQIAYALELRQEITEASAH